MVHVDLQDVTYNNLGRFYVVDEHNYPSVTTILSNCIDNSSLEEWKQRVGEEEANKISKFSANRGTIMHQMIEFYITSCLSTKKEKLNTSIAELKEWLIGNNNFTNEEIREGLNLFKNLYDKNLFSRIKHLEAVESVLYSKINGGYAGRVDCIYKNHNDEILILDFKTSKKPKKKEWISNYFLQISAYYLAYWELTGNRPNGGEIWISNSLSKEPQIFNVSKKDIDYYLPIFLKHVKTFHDKYLK